MAELDRANAVDTTKINGNLLTAVEMWTLKDASANNTVAALTEANNLGLPRLGASHQSNSSAKVIDISITHFSQQGNMYTFAVNYSNDRVEIDKKSNTDPLLLPAAISYDQIDNVVPVLNDTVTGAAFLNSAGDLYTTAFQENKPLTRITIRRNEGDFDARKAATLRNTVCPNAVRIDGFTYAANTAKLERFVASKQFDQDDNVYFVITYQIIINEDTFIRKVFDVGIRDKAGMKPGDALIIQSTGSGGLALLNADGNFITPKSDPNILSFNTLSVEDWSFLGLE